MSEREQRTENPIVPENLTAVDILPGHIYEAKRPVCASTFLVNDRQVMWVSADRSLVQYDSPALADGRHYPKVTMEKFLKWACRDITALVPPNNWRAWAQYQALRRGSSDE